MNKMLAAMKKDSNYTYTENGALTHKTTYSKVYDMFALGGAMRNRSDLAILTMFKEALDESVFYAMKCLFYLRDVRGGQGERRFFRLCLNWLASNQPAHVKMIMKRIPEYGRWDDLYALDNTPVEKDMYAFIKEQLLLDVDCETPSLLAKWLKSENASSKETKRLATKTREALGLSPKEYRVLLTNLRKKINIVETLMSQNRWDEIKFDKIPSKAGLKYKNAFARNEITSKKYRAFMRDKNTKVNAGTLYPYEVVEAARWVASSTDRDVVNKYWENLTNYFKNCELDALAVVDTSGSMHGTPLNVACSIGLYLAEKNKGPFHDSYIAFSRNPRLIDTSGLDFVDKVQKIYRANLCENTDIEKVFKYILDMLITKKISEEDLPKNIIVISDMEFDQSMGYYLDDDYDKKTLFEKIKARWESLGFKMPHLIFWNVDARQNNIPILGDGLVSYVSGFSPIIFETIMSGKYGYDLMLEKLNSERYKVIY